MRTTIIKVLSKKKTKTKYSIYVLDAIISRLFSFVE